MNQDLKHYKQEDEISLGEFFESINQLFLRCINVIKNGLKKIAHALIFLLYFALKKRLIVLLFILLGLLINRYIDYKNDEQNALEPIQYQSSMLLKPELGFLEQLKSDIAYYNLLLSEKKYQPLSEDLSVTLSVVKKINSFKLEPTVTQDSTSLFKLTLITYSKEVPQQLETAIFTRLKNTNPGFDKALELEKTLLKNREIALKSLISNSSNAHKLKNYYDELKTIQQNRLNLLNPIKVYAHLPKLAVQIPKIKIAMPKQITLTLLYSLGCFYIFFALVALVGYIKAYMKNNFEKN